MQRFKFGQWVLEVEDTGYELYNPGPNGEKRFFRVVPGQYGAPVIEPEPDLAFAVPTDLRYKNGKGEAVLPPTDQKIAGIICQDGPRCSLTHAKSQGVEIKVNDDGSIQVGEEKWWITTLFQKDKNRFRNLDAYCVKVKPQMVRLLELGDLDLY